MEYGFFFFFLVNIYTCRWACNKTYKYSCTNIYILQLLKFILCILGDKFLSFSHVKHVFDTIANTKIRSTKHGIFDISLNISILQIFDFD